MCCTCMYHVVNIAEFSPSSDRNYPSSGGSPLSNKTQSPIPPQNSTGNLCNFVYNIVSM